MKIRTHIIEAALLLALPSLAGAAVWEIDPGHSSAGFKVRHLMVSNVAGAFNKVSGSVVIDEADVTRSTVEATIDSSSIDTANADRDAHLKSPDFFDVEKHPTITFKSKRVEKAGEGRLKVTGDLTLRGVTKEVILEVEGPIAPVTFGKSIKSGASATTKINRQDFGVSWSRALEGGGLVVGDEVTINIELELVKKQ
ncbi:MAG TPA: YceI family protein [Candidatus Polarisedimenticolia bacterium]|nr:YceI family protein [Candidatus Polarisedimenticolia bacterium]